MIHQIAPVATKTGSLAKLNRDLMQARHIQHNVQGRTNLPSHGVVWSPMTAGPFVVPVTRWIE